MLVKPMSGCWRCSRPQLLKTLPNITLTKKNPPPETIKIRQNLVKNNRQTHLHRTSIYPLYLEIFSGLGGVSGVMRTDESNV